MQRLTVSVLAMLTLLPLLWIQVLRTAAGTLFLFELALVVAVAGSLSALTLKSLRAALGRVWWWTLWMTLGIIVWAAASFYHGVAQPAIAKQILFLVSFLVLVSAFSVMAADPRHQAASVLRWSGVTAVVTLLGAFAVSAVVNGVALVPVIASGLSSGDPDVLERELFRPLFAGFGYDKAEVVSQFRHEVFAGLLVALLVAAWARSCAPLQSRTARAVYTSGLAVGLACVVLSLSRSVLLAAIAWPAIEVVRIAVRGRLTRGQAATLMVAFLAAVAFVLSGFATVLLARVTSDSASYGERRQLWGLALNDIASNPWSGGRYSDSISAHNFVIDAWLRGGVGMGILMALALAVVAVRAARTSLLAVDGAAQAVPVAVAFALPLVRMFTIGAGLLQPAEWVALAFALAVSSHELARAHERRAPRVVVSRRELTAA